MRDVFISGAARTPMGGFQGVFATVDAPALGGAAVMGAVEGAGVSAGAEMVLGRGLPAGRRVERGCACNDGQQDVRGGHEYRDDGL